MNYEQFLEKKKLKPQKSGFEVDESKLNKHLFDFQRFIVKRALHHGKYAIFADCGLGKTLMQLEWASKVAEHEIGKVLIVAPLAVAGQTINEGIKFGIECAKYFDNTDCNIQIVNYEQLDNVKDDFVGLVLDESSILKNYEGKTKQLILEKFADTKYKLLLLR